jgi:hypothetical protein
MSTTNKIPKIIKEKIESNVRVRVPRSRLVTLGIGVGLPMMVGLVQNMLEDMLGHTGSRSSLSDHKPVRNIVMS